GESDEMISEKAQVESARSAIISSEELGHKVSSLEDRYQGLRRLHEARLKDVISEVKELSKLIGKEKSELQELRARREGQLRELELRISGQILELRESRSGAEGGIEAKIKDHIHRMETLELSRSAEIDIHREDQFEEVSRSLNGLTQKVECLRKKRKSMAALLKEELAGEESVRREGSVQGLRQLLDDTLSHFQTEMAASRINRLEMDRQILEQLELACQDTENKLSRMISYSENQNSSN
ncbi:hypothetical protein OIY81_3332, partial [Cryptosporidium canis]